MLLAKGLNPDEGGAEIVVCETPSGGAAFSVGSIVWPASLLVDEGVSRITANVLRRFLGCGQRLRSVARGSAAHRGPVP